MATPLRPLAGIRVVELGSAASIAFAARLLADLGAEVVKIEPPEGDPLRRQGPFLPGGGGGGSALFGYLNHGKRSLAVDPYAAADTALFGDLLRGADLLLWAADGPVAPPPLPDGASLLRPESRAPRPTVVALTACGMRGPRAGRAGSEFVAQHSGGYAWHQACPVTDPAATPPLGCVDHEAALLVGLVAANAALWGLAAVARDGAAPPFIDLSAEDVFAWMLVDALADLHGGVLPPDRGRAPGREITIAGGLVWFLPCADGAILVSPREDHQWRRWVELMGSPAWAEDAALCGTRAARTANAAALQALMAEWSRGERKRDVFERAQAARVACFPASTAADLVENRQLRARGFFRALGGDGGTLVPGLPFAMRASGGAALPRGGAVAAPALDAARADLAAWPPRRQPVPGGHAAAEAAKRPLSGLRVADFSWVVAGPMATKALGALGAEIIKIESTARPEFAYREGWFAVINNNKRSCTLDITTPEGQALVRGLVARSDVAVENFSSRVLAKHGLAYADLARVRPELVFVSASGLGREGPERDLLAYGSLLQAYSGRVALTGRMNPKLEAMGVMPAWTDPVTSLWESLAILAALRHRDATGEGAFIDLSMLEATVALLPDAVLHAAALGRETAERGCEAEIGAAPSGCFRCAGEDAWLALSVRGDAEWAGLCRAIGRADLLDDANFATAAGRLRAKPALDAAVAAWCRTRRPAEAEAALQAQRVPAAPSRGIRDLVEDSHLRERGVFRQLDDGGWSITLPWVDAEGWRGDLSPTPALGADNAYVLGEILGLPADRQRALAEAGAVR